MDTLDEQAAVQSELCFERIEKAVDDLNHTIAGYIEQYKEDQALIQKLKAQINKDNTNSSIPTSQRPNHRTPPNNREKTRRKPGGQKGHKGHKRNKLPPTEIYHIQAPDDIVNSPDYYKQAERSSNS